MTEELNIDKLYIFGDIIIKDYDKLYYEDKTLIDKKNIIYPQNGIFKVYTPKQNLLLEMTYLNGKRNGITKGYYNESNILLLIHYYTDGKLDGVCQTFSKAGKLEKEISFVNGVKEGVERKYFEDGRIKEEVMYKANIQNGFAKKYYPNGQVRQDAQFVKNKQEGPTHAYYESGALKYKGQFKNDKPIGWGISYYENGNVEWELPYGNTKGVETKYYENGNVEFTIDSIGEKRNGKFVKYDKQGYISEVGYYKNGKLYGEYTIYYKNGTVKEVSNYVNDNLHGKQIGYDKDGNIKYTYSFKKDLRDGLSIAYGKNGKIESKLKYKNGIPLLECFNKNIVKPTIDDEYIDDIDIPNEDIVKELKDISKKLDEIGGQKEKKEPIKTNKKTKYELEFVNCSRDIDTLTNQIIKSKNLNFSMCIYGDSGTGKSAYARYLADKLGIDVVIKTAADLLNQYVGEGEKNIQKAFEEAKEKKAMLIIDEVDSVLLSRSFAHRSWEITIVNQMLTCMESFEYPFVCTTNYMDSLDQASLRRFTFKFKFGFLKPQKIKSAFEYVFKIEPNDKILKMNGLTVSDFVNTKKECDILKINDIDSIANILEDIISLKKSENLKTCVGFN